MSKSWLVAALLALAAASPGRAQDWIEIRADRFTVLSQLNERDTRDWAREFGRFVNALHGLLPLNQNLLPPLTAVLFRRTGGFSPYRMRTESGLVGGNRGVFINDSTWSLIGMPGDRNSSELSTTYHEAVHWFMSADPARQPLWFREGIAEVFSTFETDGDDVKWGQPISDNLRFLQTTGLQPMEEFLQVSQDEAMHVNATYYSQAWLFVHYLLFGRLDGPELLGRFLTSSQGMSPIDAFHAAFPMDLDEMDRLLLDYSRSHRLNVGRNPVDDSGEAELVVRPAPDDLVELSLARLAFGTGNDDLLAGHLEHLVEIAPGRAEAYDLWAAWELRDRTGDPEARLDAAIARGSRDARTYQLKAAYRIDALRRREPMFSPTALEPDDARLIADYVVQAAKLQPTNLENYRLLGDVLYSVDEVLDTDEQVLEIGAIVHPGQGIIPIARAALALAADDTDEARRLIDLALTDRYELSASEASAARELRRQLR